MQCRTHPTITASNTCNTCGEWLCDACTVDINGRLFCRTCLAKLAETEAPPHGAPYGYRPPPPPGFVPIPPHLYGKPQPNGFFTFIFSFFPGANYMYLGLLKRGLAAMGLFFLNIYLLVIVSGSIIGGPLTVLLALGIPVSYLSFMFDGFNIRRRICAGEVVPDGIEDVTAFLRRNKKPLLTILVLCVLLGIASSVLGFILRPLLSLIPFIIIGLLLYMVFKRKA